MLPISCQKLASDVEYHLTNGTKHRPDGTPQKGFGWAFRSGNGKLVAVITEMGGYELESDTCTLSIYGVNDELTKKDVLELDWCDIEYGQIDASFSPCGQLLSIRRTLSQYDPIHWALYDFTASLSEDKKVFDQAVTEVAHTRQVQKIFFTADGDAVIELDRNHVLLKCPSISQHIGRFFGFLGKTPRFANKVVFV